MNIIDYQQKADLLKLLSHPVRLQIIDELRKRKGCVCHLQAVTNRPQAYISQQLRILREAGIVIDEKDGQNVYYHLKNHKIWIFLEELLGKATLPVCLPHCTCPFCTE